MHRSSYFATTLQLAGKFSLIFSFSFPFSIKVWYDKGRGMILPNLFQTETYLSVRMPKIDQNGLFCQNWSDIKLRWNKGYACTKLRAKTENLYHTS